MMVHSLSFLIFLLVLSVSRATISIVGRQIRIDNVPFHMKGVNWNPVGKGDEQNGGLNFSGFVEQDSVLMANAGINVIRTYHPITDIFVLDTLWSHGIYVINTVYTWGGTTTSTLVSHVNAVKNHSAILMWAVGNEWNYNKLYTDMSFNDARGIIRDVVRVIKQQDTSHPVTTVYGELPAADTLSYLEDIDVWGVNVYRGIGFGNIFQDWSDRSGKPMYLGEYGADAYDARNDREDQDAQAEATTTLTNLIVAQSSVLGGVCSGGIIFEFADEWWKAGEPSTHDVGGYAPGGGPYPDDTFNEEWWGLLDIDRQPRKAYTAYRNVVIPSGPPSTTTVPGTAVDSTSIEVGSTSIGTGLGDGGCDGVLSSIADGYTCGERIDYLKVDEGMVEKQARHAVGQEFPNACGACASLNLSCEEVLSFLAEGHTCGGRIQWLIENTGMLEIQARIQVGGEFPSECGACRDSSIVSHTATATPGSTLSLEVTTTISTYVRTASVTSGSTLSEDLTTTVFTYGRATTITSTFVGSTSIGGAGLGDGSCEDVMSALIDGYTCGERIEHMKEDEGMVEKQARHAVAQQFPNACGACASPNLSCEEVLSFFADDRSCGGRIEWLRLNMGMTEMNARIQVGTEYPNECGPCADSSISTAMVTSGPTSSRTYSNPISNSFTTPGPTTSARCNPGYYFHDSVCIEWGCNLGINNGCATCVEQPYRHSAFDCASCNLGFSLVGAECVLESTTSSLARTDSSMEASTSSPEVQSGTTTYSIKENVIATTMLPLIESSTSLTATEAPGQYQLEPSKNFPTNCSAQILLLPHGARSDCPAVTEDAQRCSVLCDAGSRSVGSFTCLDGIFVGDSKCLALAEGQGTVIVSKVVGGFKISLEVSKVLSQEKSKLIFKQGVAESLGVVVGDVVKLLVDKVNSRRRALRRLGSAQIQMYEVVFEIVAPASVDPQVLAERATAIPDMSSSESRALREFLMAQSDINAINEIAPHGRVHIFEDEIALAQTSGSIATHEDSNVMIILLVCLVAVIGFTVVAIICVIRNPKRKAALAAKNKLEGVIGMQDPQESNENHQPPPEKVVDQRLYHRSRILQWGVDNAELRDAAATESPPNSRKNSLNMSQRGSFRESEAIIAALTSSPAVCSIPNESASNQSFVPGTRFSL